MKFDDKVPIYYQIKQHIYHEMMTGKLEPGAQLPAVRQLALTLTVNVNTVQRALSEMIAEGTLTSQRGKGNFVTTDTTRISALKKQLVTSELATFYAQLHALNLTDAEIISQLQNYVAQRGKQDEHSSNA